MYLTTEYFLDLSYPTPHQFKLASTPWNSLNCSLMRAKIIENQSKIDHFLIEPVKTQQTLSSNASTPQVLRFKWSQANFGSLPTTTLVLNFLFPDPTQIVYPE
jgi:hypothetical protein